MEQTNGGKWTILFVAALSAFTFGLLIGFIIRQSPVAPNIDANTGAFMKQLKADFGGMSPEEAAALQNAPYVPSETEYQCYMGKCIPCEHGHCQIADLGATSKKKCMRTCRR